MLWLFSLRPVRIGAHASEWSVVNALGDRAKRRAGTEPILGNILGASWHTLGRKEEYLLFFLCSTLLNTLCSEKGDSVTTTLTKKSRLQVRNLLQHNTLLWTTKLSGMRADRYVHRHVTRGPIGPV